MSQSTNRQKIIKELDALTSLYVRKKEKKCFTCGKRLLFRKRQAGHYIARSVLATRWNTDNVHVQCAKCNVDLGGNIDQYGEKLPPETRKYLDAIYDKYKHGKLRAPSLKEMTAYRDYLKEVLEDL